MTTLKAARKGARRLVGRLPAAFGRARAGARDGASTLQAMPDPNRRLLAAGSIGLAAGLYLAGAPRLVSLAGLAPACIVGTASVFRPDGRRVSR